MQIGTTALMGNGDVRIDLILTRRDAKTLRLFARGHPDPETWMAAWRMLKRLTDKVLDMTKPPEPAKPSLAELERERNERHELDRVYREADADQARAGHLTIGAEEVARKARSSEEAARDRLVDARKKSREKRPLKDITADIESYDAERKASE